MARAELARFIDRFTIEYVRVYPHPIERVWRAVSDPSHVSAWFWTAAFEPKVGAPYAFGPDRDMRRVITACDPPRLMPCRWKQRCKAERVRCGIVAWSA